jgi:hypothetical protein
MSLNSGNCTVAELLVVADAHVTRKCISFLGKGAVRATHARTRISVKSDGNMARAEDMTCCELFSV